MERLLSELASMPDFLEKSFSGLSTKDAATPGRDDSFSPVEQCWHLADLEREAYSVRIRRLLSEASPRLPDFDGARIARERDYKSLSLMDGIESFRRARAANLAVLRGISSEDWQRGGEQDGAGPVMLCDIPGMMAEHDAVHRSQIEAWIISRSSTRHTTGRRTDRP